MFSLSGNFTVPIIYLASGRTEIARGDTGLPSIIGSGTGCTVRISESLVWACVCHTVSGGLSLSYSRHLSEPSWCYLRLFHFFYPRDKCRQRSIFLLMLLTVKFMQSLFANINRQHTDEQVRSQHQNRRLSATIELFHFKFFWVCEHKYNRFQILDSATQRNTHTLPWFSQRTLHRSSALSSPLFRIEQNTVLSGEHTKDVDGWTRYQSRSSFSYFYRVMRTKST